MNPVLHLHTKFHKNQTSLAQVIVYRHIKTFLTDGVFGLWKFQNIHGVFGSLGVLLA